MIGRIRGILIEKQAPVVLIEAFGIGYEVLTPMTSIYRLPDLGKEAILYTHFIVREDIQQLYGFISKTDRKIFQELIKVNGVGAKMALAVLSGMDADSVLASIEREDSGLLVSIPGIGKKTAERIIVEMRDKVVQISQSLSEMIEHLPIELNDTPKLQADSQINVEPINKINNKSNDLNEAIQALVALGYKQAEAQKTIYKVKGKADSTEGLIKSALQLLVRH